MPLPRRIGLPLPTAALSLPARPLSLRVSADDLTSTDENRMTRERQHDLDHGADCWCEPRVECVEQADGEIARLFIHWCDDCECNPCVCEHTRKLYHSKQ